MWITIYCGGGLSGIVIYMKTIITCIVGGVLLVGILLSVSAEARHRTRIPQESTKNFLRAQMEGLAGTVDYDTSMTNGMSMPPYRQTPMLSDEGFGSVYNPSSAAPINSSVYNKEVKTVTGERLNGESMRVGPASVHSGSDTVSDYIRATGGFLRFLIGKTVNTAVEKMRISANGHVGIGTENPRYKLEVMGSSPFAQSIYSSATDTSATRIGVKNSKQEWAVSNYGTSAQPNHAFIISDETIPAVRLVIAPKTGNVGIGTANPQKRLHIDNGGIMTDDIETNKICLPNGSAPVKLKCFKSVCPGENGQWTLSENKTCPAGEDRDVSTLTVALNPDFNTPTYPAGVKGVRVGSFKITVSGRESVQIISVSFDKDQNQNFDVSNLKVMLGKTQFGMTQEIVGDTERQIIFSGSSALIPANGSVIVDVYADILSSTTSGAHSSVFDLTSGTALETMSNHSVTWPAAVDGQNIVISAGLLLTLSTDRDNIFARYIVMSSVNNILYKLQLSANNSADMRITDITFTDTIINNTAGGDSFNNFRLLNDMGEPLAGPVNVTITGSTPAKIRFNLGVNSSLIVPKNSSRTVVLRGDAMPFISGAVSHSGHTFGVASTDDVTAYGKDSNSSATVSGTPSGTQQTVYRTKPSVTSSVIGATMGRTRTVVDEIAKIDWKAHAADDLTIQKVTIKLIGMAVNNASAFTVYLRDANTNDAWGDSQEATCAPIGTAGCAVTFRPDAIITRGTTKTAKLWVNSSQFGNVVNTSDSLSATIDTASDILWGDGTTGNITYEPAQTPITIVNISYE